MVRCTEKLHPLPKGAMKLAKELAVQSGELLLRHRDKPKQISNKGLHVNLVTDIDLRSERMIERGILRGFPEHGYLLEEGAEKSGKGDWRWVCDPLDGTTNFAHGFPHFCVSIALEFRGQTVLGVIFNPNLGELFWARKGGGAFMNGKRIHVSETRKLSKALLTTGFPYDKQISPDNNMSYFEAFTMIARAVRRPGSAALDLAYVAMGRFDGFWEFKLSAWDLAAGGLLVTEAGGKISGMDGETFDPHTGHVIAATKAVHPKILKLIRKTAVWPPG